MSATPPPAGPPPRSFLDDLIGRVLGYMDKPWKAAAIVVLIVVLGIGYAAWVERRVLTAWLAPPAGPMVLKSDVSGEIDDLINHKVDLVMVWSIELARNTATYVEGRQRAGGVFRFDPDQLPAIGDATDPAALAKLLNGQPWCDGIPRHGTPFGDRLLGAGMTAMCIVPVPPSPVELLVGIIVLAWKSKPNPAYEAAAVGLAKNHAARMVLR